MTSAILSCQEICKIDGCEKPIAYRGDRICQMHYFRRMRTGHFDKTYCAPGELRMNHSNGYVMLRLPDHPLSQKRGGVFEHRKVMYDIYGESLPPCELCGRESQWRSRSTHIDHIDCNRKNNLPENLRVLCNPCNAGRNRTDLTAPIEIDGVEKTALQWSREDDAQYSVTSIKRRIQLGLSPKQAIYGKKFAHIKIACSRNSKT